MQKGVKPIEFVFDMVHHNPGEARFETAFDDPRHLKEYGYTGKVFRNINCLLTLNHAVPDLFPASEQQRRWYEQVYARMESEMRAASEQGLMVIHHIDPLVFPGDVVERFREEICDPRSGRIDFARPRTRELLEVMFEEMFSKFEYLDGLFIRVGETYLYDFPYHAGNNPIQWSQDGPDEQEMGQYVEFIRYMREVICEKHGRYLFFRTWDCFSDRFHANQDYYLAVTDRIEPHEKLLFSIKHTAVDFWNTAAFNPCLGVGKHRQIVEVQSQREYEGKGAFPSYVMDKVIDGFAEVSPPRGIRDVLSSGKIRGVFGWSRGGGWYGPYLENEMWCDVHAYVLGRWAQDSDREEQAIFGEYCKERLSLGEEDTKRLRKIGLLGSEAVRKGFACRVYDEQFAGLRPPANLWIRDDRIAGLGNLKEVFEYLYDNNRIGEALEEKAEAAGLWKRIQEVFEQMNIDDPEFRSFLETSILYGTHLFAIICHGWEALLLGYQGDRDGQDPGSLLGETIRKYDQAWEKYRRLAQRPECATQFRADVFWAMPEDTPPEGMDGSIDRYRALVD